MAAPRFLTITKIVNKGKHTFVIGDLQHGGLNLRK
jgi:hypothetical protein